MKRIYIYVDEAYPIYSTGTKRNGMGIPVKIPKRDYERWEKISKEYDKIQTEMRKLIRD